MCVISLFDAFFIFTSIIVLVKGNDQFLYNLPKNSTTLEPTYQTSTFNIQDNEGMSRQDENLIQPEETRVTINHTQTPLFLNLVINLNFITEQEKKTKKQRNLHALTQRQKKIARDHVKLMNSGNLGSMFEKIKLKMETQRRKRNIEFQNIGEDKSSLQNETSKNKIEGLPVDKFPKMSLLNEDKEMDVTKWLKNWKDILAVNPVLSTEKATKPEVEYIDEWKYSYRVTLYNSDSYNVSNFLCSGILVSSQWVLTSVSCKLGDDVTLLIGVHTLPKTISEHNKYGVLKKVYSLNENLELIQMDRPVQWSFKVPDIRSVKMEEMEDLLHTGKCRLFSWIPVDIDKDIFELRHYPQLALRPEMRKSPKKNSLRVSPFQPYRMSKKDVGSPVLCDDVVTGMVLEVDLADDSMTVGLLCPVLEWITFFTKEGAYFEVTARKITLRNWAMPQVPLMWLLIFSFCFVCVRR